MNTQAAIARDCTMYPNNVFDASSAKHVLKRSNNTKLAGATFRRGPFAGMPLYSLTLTERETCDASCPLRDVCYGNNMPFAHRFIANANLLTRLESDLESLARKHPRGFVIRLHILGDFYSRTYVQFWWDMLKRYSNLYCYGYTHAQGPIKDAIDHAYARFPGRFVIYQSDGVLGRESRPCANVNESRLPICPQQTGKVVGCVNCGLCTNARIKGVSWLIH